MARSWVSSWRNKIDAFFSETSRQSREQKSGVRLADFEKDEWWELFLSEINRTNPFSKFTAQFKEHCESRACPVVFALCAGRQADHHPAFIRRCHLEAQRRLCQATSSREALRYYGNLDWRPAEALSDFDERSDYLKSFDAPEGAMSFDSWIRERQHGLCFSIHLEVDEWDEIWDKNFRDMVSRVMDAAHGEADVVARTCLIFLVVHTSDDSLWFADKLTRLIEGCGHAGKTIGLGELSTVKPSHVESWYDARKRSNQFRHVLSEVGFTDLRARVFPVHENDETEQELRFSDALYKIQKFIRSEANNPPRQFVEERT